MADQDFIARIEARLAELKLSPRAASLIVGDKPDLFRSVLSGRTSNPRRDTLKKMAAALEVSEEWLLHGHGEPEVPSQMALPDTIKSRVHVPRSLTHTQDIPVMGTAAGAIVQREFEGFEIGTPVDYVSRPAALMGARDIYALYVTGDSMVPAHNPGDLRFVHPHRPVAPGSTVIVQTRAWDGIPGQAYIKRLLRRTAGKITLEQLNPLATIEIPTEHVTALHKVLSTNELFGV